MINTRFAAAAALLIAVALVPTVIHSYGDLKTDDGYVATVIDHRLAELTSRPSDRQAAWVKRFLDSDNWFERHYRKPAGGEISLFVSRSFDMKRLYHHPELAVAYGHDLRGGGTQHLESIDGLVVHVLRGNPEAGTGLAVYALLYGDEFVENPYTFQMRTAGELLFSPRRPMTLLFALDEGARADAPIEDAMATQVLVDAIRSFRAQTPSPATR